MLHSEIGNGATFERISFNFEEATTFITGNLLFNKHLS